MELERYSDGSMNREYALKSYGNSRLVLVNLKVSYKMTIIRTLCY